MTDTEPLDLDAVYDRWIDWYNGTPTPGRWSHLDADESMSHCLAREDVPALIAEVRRLREITGLTEAGSVSKGEAVEFFRELAAMVEQDIDGANDMREFREECSDAFKALGVGA